MRDLIRDAVHFSVIHYSATGTVYRLALAAREGAEKAGAEVRLRRVRELASPEAMARNPQWMAHSATVKEVPVGTLEDLEWADVVLFGSPTRYGMISAQLREYINSTGPLWQAGNLANKVYGAFTSAATAHGGHESTLLSLAAVFHHWGGIMVPSGYRSPVRFQAGNPNGTSGVGTREGGPSAAEMEAARYQAQRAVEVALALKAGRRAQEAVA
jgi:NAD(P)H dehydrogenase (quinone)